MLLAALLASQPAANDYLRRYLQQHLYQVRSCYERELVRNPRLEARVSLRLVFDGLGRALHASVAGSPSADLERCILVSARGWSLPEWEAATRLCDFGPCTAVHPMESHRLIVSYPIQLRPSKSADELDALHREARACWDWAVTLGVAGEVGAHVSRHAESDGFEVVSVEETTLPPPAALCLARVALRHLGRDTDQWFWFHALGD